MNLAVELVPQKSPPHLSQVRHPLGRERLLRLRRAHRLAPPRELVAVAEHRAHVAVAVHRVERSQLAEAAHPGRPAAARALPHEPDLIELGDAGRAQLGAAAPHRRHPAAEGRVALVLFLHVAIAVLVAIRRKPRKHAGPVRPRRVIHVRGRHPREAEQVECVDARRGEPAGVAQLPLHLAPTAEVAVHVWPQRRVGVAPVLLVPSQPRAHRLIDEPVID
mmetsp:Transcript_35417/g.117374  ORF Transcript_35417/g.117374 Transcript_35417/m.117374 type:complete len:220 (-) Transcript_35417:107-766(-)